MNKWRIQLGTCEVEFITMTRWWVQIDSVIYSQNVVVRDQLKIPSSDLLKSRRTHSGGLLLRETSPRTCVFPYLCVPTE